jgi:hypothetical protein
VPRTERPLRKNITKRIQEPGAWRGETLARVRQLIHDADPEIQEEWKWMGTPVWSHGGDVFTGEPYKQAVKLTFFRGASLQDPTSCSTPVSRETRAEPSTFAKARSSTRPPSGN